MTVSLVQNFFKQTVTTPWTVGTGNFYVSQKPNVTSGFLVISPNSESLREIVAFSAVGTDGGGDFVTVSARGLGGTTEQAHGAGEKVYMNITAQHIEQIKQAIEDINNAGALNASTTVKGVARLTASPNVSLGNPTITIASPAVVTLTAHGLTENDEIQFTTDGTLPTGITASVKYYVISTGLTTDEFQFSETFGGAAVATSGSQSGTHTLTKVTPVAASANDTRFPSTDQAAALAGDGVTPPSSTNPFATKYSTKFGIRKLTSGETINGATLPVPVYQNKTDNEFYACDADDTNRLEFIGFAVSDATDGTTIDIQFNGIVTGFSSLNEGEKYYVQDAIGTIGTTVGTNALFVGTAISETEILIGHAKKVRNGSFALSDVGNSGATQDSAVITLGYRPRIIRAFANQNAASSPVSPSTGVCLWLHGAAVSTPGTYTPSVISVTDTSFIIRVTQNTSSPVAGTCVWEVEG